MPFRVYSKRCDECLFSDAKIVSDTRKASVLADCAKRDTYFVCHKSSLAGDEPGVMCRGHYDDALSRGSEPQLLQIARRLNAVAFVPLPKKAG